LESVGPEKAHCESSLSAEMFATAARAVEGAERIFVTSHWRPDGDAIGCLVALREVFRGLGKEVITALPDCVPRRYELLAEKEPIPRWGSELFAADVGDVDLLVIADTAAWAQVEPIAEFIKSCNARRLIVDHHVTRNIEAEVGLFDPGAGATAVILFEWFRSVGWRLDDVAAEGLFVGLATDSGWFRFGNADARLMRVAAELVGGWRVSPARLYRRLYMSDPASRVRLLAKMLGTLELHIDGKLAICCLTREMFREAGAEYWETEDLINEPQRIGTVQVAALLIEDPDGKVRISLRSKDGPDVAEIAREFDGGGHEHAAGARIAGNIEQVKRRLIEVVAAKLQALPSDGEPAEGDS